MKCKHDKGWYVGPIYLNVTADGTIRRNFQIAPKRGFKLLARCINPECTAKRNIYIRAEVSTWGKLKK